MAQGVPVLMYHRIGPLPKRTTVPGHYVRPKLFQNHVRLLQFLGYRSACLNGIVGSLFGKAEGPLERTVAITFDDGYRSFSQLAVPALQAGGFTATVFAVADLLGRSNAWDEALGDATEPLMTEDELRAVHRLGFGVGSHTCTHPHLTMLSDEELHQEVSESKMRLEQVLRSNIRLFCYPYGAQDVRERAAVRQAGYSAACSTKKGMLTPACDPFAMPRINVRSDTWTPVLFLKLHRLRS